MGGEVGSDEPRFSGYRAAQGREMGEVRLLGPAVFSAMLASTRAATSSGTGSGIAIVQVTARNGTRRWAIDPLAEPTGVHPTSCLARLQGVFWVVISGDQVWRPVDGGGLAVRRFPARAGVPQGAPDSPHFGQGVVARVQKRLAARGEGL